MNWLDIVIIVCIIIGIIRGFVNGIVKQIISLVSLIAAILLSGAVAGKLIQWAQPYIKTENPVFSPNIQNAIFYIVAFVLIIALFAVVAKLADTIINYTPAGIINKIFGALFGTFMWIICLSIILNFLAVFDTQSQIITQTAKENSVYYERVKMLFPTAFPYIKEFLKTEQCLTIHKI